MLTAVWLTLAADVNVDEDIAGDVLVLVDSIFAVLEMASEVASEVASGVAFELVSELEIEVVSFTEVTTSVAETVVDVGFDVVEVDLDVVEVAVAFLVVVESSSGHAPSVHGSIEQHPVYGPAVQTYHCLPSVQVLPACCKPSILEGGQLWKAKQQASRVSHEMLRKRSRPTLGNIENVQDRWVEGLHWPWFERY